jgi:uncharacterized protein YwgA
MDRKLVALKLLLEEVGIKPSTGKHTDRKDMQKAICLMQEAGIDLGYNFNWYKEGPYSPVLTDDYYNLTKQNKVGLPNYSLVEKTKEKLAKIRSIFDKDLSIKKRSDWLELVASVCFLLNKGYTSSEVKKIFEDQKPHLASYTVLAEKKLREVGLVKKL